MIFNRENFRLKNIGRCPVRSRCALRWLQKSFHSALFRDRFGTIFVA